MSDEAKEIENLTMRHDIESTPGCIHCEALNLARRLLAERDEAYKQGFGAAAKRIISREGERIASLERELEEAKIQIGPTRSWQCAKHDFPIRFEYVEGRQCPLCVAERELEEASDKALEGAAQYLESSFGRCNLLTANGYLNGDDVAEKIRALKSKP